MTQELKKFPITYPTLQGPDCYPGLKAQIHKANWEAITGVLSQNELDLAYRVVECAAKIGPAVCTIPENKGKEGFALTFTKKELTSWELTFQIGNVADPDPEYTLEGKIGKYCAYATEKAQVLKNHPDFISSSQNLTLPPLQRLLSPKLAEIPGGAIAFENGYIVSVSAFKNANMDTATALAIAAAAGIATADEVEKIARDPRVNCQEFLSNEDRILVEPVLH